MKNTLHESGGREDHDHVYVFLVFQKKKNDAIFVRSVEHTASFMRSPHLAVHLPVHSTKRPGRGPDTITSTC